MKTIKKVLSILLVLATLFSISVASTLSASAAYYESESNDSYATADILKVGNKIEGKLNSHKDVDIYKVTVSSIGILTFNFWHEHNDVGGGWTVYVYQCRDGKYTVLSSQTIYISSDAKVTLPFVGTSSSEEYYVRVDTWNSAVKDMEYAIECSFSSTAYECYEKEENNSYATATVISANKEYKGYMNKHTDVDIYKVLTSKNGKLTINFMHDTDDNGGGWDIALYQYSDGKYTCLSEQTIYRASDAKISLPSINAVTSGIYFIRVNTWNSAVTYKEYSITAKSSTEPSVDIGTGENVGGNDDNITDPGFSFMDVLNAVLDFFKWLFSAVLSFFS